MMPPMYTDKNHVTHITVPTGAFCMNFTLDKSNIEDVEISPISWASVVIPVENTEIAGLQIIITVDPNILLASFNGAKFSMSDIEGIAYDAVTELAKRLKVSN